MNVAQIIQGIIFVILLYLVYSYFFTDHSTKEISMMRDGREQKTIQAQELPANVMGTNDYTYSIWLYINDWNYRYGAKKVIISKTDTQNKPSPEIFLHETLNNIIVRVNVYDVDAETRSRLDDCVLDNVPLQKWFNLIVTLNNRALDLYIDGKLVRTCVLSGVPKTNPESNIVITPNSNGQPGGFSGKTAMFRYMGHAVNPRQAYDIYRQGFGGGSFLGGLMDKYGVKFSLMVDNEERYKVKI